MVDEAKILEMIENTRETGKIKIGVNEVTKAIERGKPVAVVYAEDVNPKEIVMHLKPLCKEKNIPVFTIANKDKLGKASGINVPTTSIAIIQPGEGEKILEELKKSE